MQQSKRKVIFLLAPSFHGATLLSLILGNHKDIVSLGDTLPSLLFDQICGCGRKVSTCDFWQELTEQIPEKGREHLFLEYPNLFSRNAQVNKAVSFGFSLLLNKLSLPYQGYFHQQYSFFHEYVTGYYSKEILLDGFKSINRYLFVKASGYEVLGVIHLVRDPRAFVVSARKNMDVSIQEATKIYKSYHTNVLNVFSLIPENYIRVKYEDFVSNPDLINREILEKMGLNNENLVYPFDSSVHWMGNSSLFNFTGKIYKNDKWMKVLSKQENDHVLNETSLLCQKFNYS